MRKQLLLSSLVIFLAQPMCAMEADTKLRNTLNHQLITLAEYAETDEEIAEMNHLISLGTDVNAKELDGRTALVFAANQGKYKACQTLIAAGADLNTADTEMSILHWALSSSPSHRTIKLLLDHGADIRSYYPIVSLLHGTPLEICAYRLRGSLHRPLIIYSKFTPYYTAKQLQDAHVRTHTRLCCLARSCPKLPRDIKDLILCAYDDEVCKDTYATPIKLHTLKHDRVTEMPLQTIRALLQWGALHLGITVQNLKAHKYNQLKPLMAIASQGLADPEPNERLELNPEWLEQNFGKEIEEVIIADCLRNEGDAQ